MISLYTHIAYWSWSALFVVWLIGHFRNKRTLHRQDTGRYLGTTVLLIASYCLLFGSYFLGWFGLPLTPQTAVLGILGDVLCIGGILFATWARITLGSNWSGSTATLKEDHELIPREGRTHSYAIRSIQVFSSPCSAWHSRWASGRVTSESYWD